MIGTARDRTGALVSAVERGAVENLAALVDLLDGWRANDLHTVRRRLPWSPAANPAQLNWFWPSMGGNFNYKRVAYIPHVAGLIFEEPDIASPERATLERFEEFRALWERDPRLVAYRVIAEEVNEHLAGGVGQRRWCDGHREVGYKRGIRTRGGDAAQ